MKKLFFILLCVGWWAEAEAQVFEPGDGPRRVRTDGFWSDWFVQADLEMTLQNPYGYNFANVFPNGKSFGLDVAVGKWFSHQVGYRGKFNWENKLPLLKNDHANWLAPFDQPGVNREKGGEVAAAWLTFIETCKLQKKAALDFFNDFFRSVTEGRSDYELIAQEALG